MRVTPIVSLIWAVVLGAVAASGFAQDTSRPLVPAGFQLQEAAAKAIAEPFLKESERRDLRIRHGVWDERDLDTPARQALAALTTWNFDHQAFSDESVPPDLRAEARLLRGDVDGALQLLDGLDSIRAMRLRAEALELAGRFAEADLAVEPASKVLTGRKLEDAEELVDGVLALMVRSRVRGQPARDFQTMLTLLGSAHQDLDRLNWRARLVEAALLLEKDNFLEGITALHEALDLNPRASVAWSLLGLTALERFDFAGASTAAAALRRINPAHPLADILLAESSLVQDDPDAAAALIAPLLAREPKLREALATAAAIEGVRYDNDAMQRALAAFDALSPGHPMAHFAAGRHLSLQRQYGVAAELLDEAARRLPNWPPPLIELGLLEMQAGRDDRARQALERVVTLDPYNKRAANSLQLLRELVTFTEIESEHFLIRYRPGVDEVVARLMPDALDAMHADLVARFDHAPAQKTVIELMPDHQFFSVRISGMPWVHTIAACTGPVIALEAPRNGPGHLHLGAFDWLQVLRHEYVHTITLSQTQNRIPHWLTEAAAVSMEISPRRYDTTAMLAHEWRSGTLFDLDEINWAFVRPKRPHDRSLAYAQGAWMVEFMNLRYGTDAVVRLINRYFEGVREEQAIPEALGLSREQFLKEFLAWAGEQVKAWGMDPEPSLLELTDRLRNENPALAAAMEKSRAARLETVAGALTGRIGQPRTTPPAPGESAVPTADAWPELERPDVTIDDATLLAWRSEFPDQPDLIELVLRRGDVGAERLNEETLALLRRLIAVRPVDPYPHRRLVRHFLASELPAEQSLAAPHLAFLDQFEDKSGVYALELARIERDAGRPDSALVHVTKGVRVNGYDAPTRELAAAIAIEAERLDLARMHLEALILLEPDRPIHRERLEALARMEAATRVP